MVLHTTQGRYDKPRDGEQERTRSTDGTHLRDLRRGPAAARVTTALHLGVLSGQLARAAPTGQSGEANPHSLVCGTHGGQEVTSALHTEKLHKSIAECRRETLSYQHLLSGKNNKIFM